MHTPLEKLKIEQESRKVRIGMVYAALGAPMLGVAFGFGGKVGALPPFNLAYPTGSMAFQLFEYMFGLLAIFVYSFVVGTAKDNFRILKSKISWYGVFTAMTGMIGDFLFFSSAAIVGGAIAGPLAGLFGFWGAVVTSLIYREKILQRWTLIGVVFLVIGLWIASGGIGIAAPQGVSMGAILIGSLMGLLASIMYGIENFAIAAGSDMIPEESTLFWRAGWALVGLVIINFTIMPKFTQIGSDMFSNPMWWAYAAVTGGAWGLYMIVSLYMGINRAGAVGGGLLASTGFVWATFLSMTVYGGHWSTSLMIGSLIMFVGIAVMMLRPSKLIAKLRG
jgi:drug/metabolite transporter (DMT)-like permease